MRKAIATISVDPIIQEKCQVIQSEKDRLEQELDFLRNRVNKSVEKMKERCEEHWDVIEDRLKELGLLAKDFTPEQGSLCFDSNGNVIYYEDGKVPEGIFTQFHKN